METPLNARRRTAARRPGAFTLIELLVVVAIIALLIAILLPSLKKARAQAKRAACVANLSQIAKAWHMYLDASSGRFPQWQNSNINFGGQQGTLSSFGGPPVGDISKPLNPHMKLPEVTNQGAEVFRCPADRGGLLAPNSCYESYGTSYRTNELLIGQTQANAFAFGPCGMGPSPNLVDQINARLPMLNRSQIRNDNRLILIGDFGWVNAWSPGSSQRIEWHDRAFSHNLAFMDSHAEFVTLRKGLHVTPQYTLIPFTDLIEVAVACQQPVP